MNVAVIDSGLNELECNSFVNVVKRITIEKKRDALVYKNGSKDQCGHGTLVINLLTKYLSTNINLYVINIFKDSLSIDIDMLIEALEYCTTIECDLIQVSLGTLYSNNRLHQVIKALTRRGTIIVSAFDNDKSISYPAAYSEVVGVDVSNRYNALEKYDIIENSVIDIIGPDIYHRGMGMDQKRKIVKGSSFYTSYISAQIINLKLYDMDKVSVINELKKSAQDYFANKCCTKDIIKVERAIVFPFNKEIHSIAAFENLLSFTVEGFCDIRQRGNVLRRVCDILPYTDNSRIISDYSKLDWSLPFDTFICGHVGELNQILKRDIMEEIIRNCAAYNKRLICFDNISKYHPERFAINYWFPCMSKSMVPQFRFGKLRSPNTPIVGVFGTSSCQGKMTLQLHLRDGFTKRGVKVKNIGSEPQSVLFGFEFTYTFGYQSTDELIPEEMILVLNEAVYELEKNGCDLIIVGSQSGTVANQLRNINMIPLKQYYFLLGTQPDSIVLCINSSDSIEYINRTITFFEATVNAKVICLVVSFNNTRRWGVKSYTLDYYKENINIPIFDLHYLNINEMIEEIIKFYEETDEI